MFDKLKRYLFSKTETSPSMEIDYDPNILASITFVIKKNSDGLTVDVGIDDFNDESIIALSELLNRIFTDQAKIETLNIIQQSFLANNKENELVKLVGLVAATYKNIIGKSNGPYIKPSQMLPS